MRVVVIDGQGGRIGKTIIENLRKELPTQEIIAVGSNSIASAAMLKAGATACASGENAVIYNCGKADVICGPIGIAFANSMLGEISPTMAAAVGASNAKKIFIPMRVGEVVVLGVDEKPVMKYIDEMVDIIKGMQK